MKKQWTKPKLITLFRARSDESVLGYCKTTQNLTGPEGGVAMCNNYPEDHGVCPSTYCELDMLS